MKTRHEILNRARKILDVRGADYGDAGDMWTAVAAIWSVRVGVEISPAKAASMMANLKQVRADLGAVKEDNAVDACGYEALAGELAGGVGAAPGRVDLGGDSIPVRGTSGPGVEERFLSNAMKYRGGVVEKPDRVELGDDQIPVHGGGGEPSQ